MKSKPKRPRKSVAIPSCRCQDQDQAWCLLPFLFLTILPTFLKRKQCNMFIWPHFTQNRTTYILCVGSIGGRLMSTGQKLQYIITNHNLLQLLGIWLKKQVFLLLSFLQYEDHIDLYKQMFVEGQIRPFHAHCMSLFLIPFVMHKCSVFSFKFFT